MRIMTYNVQSGRDAWGQLHLDGTTEMIRRAAPDICGLNEIRVHCEDSGQVDQAAYLSEQTGLEARFAKAIPMSSGEYGVALLSKYPISDFTVHPVPDVPMEQREEGYYESRVIYRARVETPEGPLAVYGTHFGLMKGERENAVKLLKDLISKETLPLVFMGDLNMEPNDALIVEIEQQLYNTIKPVPEFTHHTLNLHGTIDYIFVRGLTATQASTLFSTASDHLPVLTEAHIG
ncbi:MAG: endonuclease/exonuclease/phosphatase family protein [Clostridia bacterium]|nr:endonuclease/exonuclease/phosphatase family protein [Clostridia bacterium]